MVYEKLQTYNFLTKQQKLLIYKMGRNRWDGGKNQIEQFGCDEGSIKVSQ